MSKLTACLVDEVAENKIGRVKIGRRTCQDSNRHNDEAPNRPHEGPVVNNRKQRVHGGIYNEGQQGQSDVNQELVPSLWVVCLDSS